ncbi:coatomer alpha [Cystoisospora suis]|uniref:Coatomer alpha n=1 Tax=Cystoisospora suis TaxID=483139 RepID=A0A2C6KNM8_9APIC|nr:coatomer alpha [Cystoisospora suis]
MILEMTRMSFADSDPARNIELVAYFACCKMQPSHLFLVLRRAMSVAWKAQNFVTTAAFARRLVNGNFMAIKGAQEEIAKARKVLALCEQKGTDAHVINFEPSEFDSLLLCTVTLTRLAPGTPITRCPFCGAVAKVEFSGRICPICDLSELGARVVGLQFRPLD